MVKPIFVVVSEDPPVRTGLTRDLERRFSADYDVLAADSVPTATMLLAYCAEQSRQVALVFADQALNGPTAVEFLAQTRTVHPGCRRVLVIPRGNWSSRHPVIEAMALGQVDFHLYNPWEPLERILYPAVSEFLSVWGRSQEAPVVPIRICAARHSRRSHELRDVLTRASIPFWFFDDGSDEGQALLQEVGATGKQLPVVVFYTGVALENPSNADVVSTLGMKIRPDVDRCDLIIVGAGPGGLAAAVYAASEGLDAVVLEPVVPGGQAGTSALIRNYLGFQRGISGEDLIGRAVEQAWLFGVDFVLTQEAIGLAVRGNDRVIRTADGSEVAARAVLLAVGVEWRRLGVPALEALIGAGVFYGAAGAEAKAMQGRDVFVVGAGNSAGQAALHLSRYASSVTMLVRQDSLMATMSDYLVRQIEVAHNVAVRFGTEIVDGGGDGHLEEITVRERITGQTSAFPASAVFVMIGAEPHTNWLPHAIQRDERRFILTGQDLVRRGQLPAGWPLERAPRLLETSIPGVLAVGDVRHGSVKRVASAVGEGATAVALIHEYLADVDDAT
ncbi:MAG: FAD-dependent oxidoreductase [Actinomycetota bacterium]|nr:FAD-dependent oxidoreductase [Actinomycetota bacterium]